VIVPTYNRRELLDFTLNSLARQDLPVEQFEVIVVDDGSTDDTKDIVEQYADRLILNYHFQEDKGYRPGSARNLGILNAKGRACLFVDSGIILHSSCLRQHIRMHASAATPISVLGYVYGIYQEGLTEDDLRRMITPGEPDKTIALFKTLGKGFDLREKYYKKYNDRVEDLPAPWTLFWTCNVSVRLSDLQRVGPFDENYDGRWGCEDNDLGLRLWNDGVKIRLCREAESIHLPHGKDTEARLAQGYANCEYLNKKFGTEATSLFLEYYKSIAMNESVDINELLLLKQSAFSTQS